MKCSPSGRLNSHIWQESTAAASQPPLWRLSLPRASQSCSRRLTRCQSKDNSYKRLAAPKRLSQHRHPWPILLHQLLQALRSSRREPVVTVTYLGPSRSRLAHLAVVVCITASTSAARQASWTRSTRRNFSHPRWPLPPPSRTQCHRRPPGPSWSRIRASSNPCNLLQTQRPLVSEAPSWWTIRSWAWIQTAIITN